MRFCQLWSFCAGIVLCLGYSYMLLRYVYDTAIKVPMTQRVPHDRQKIRLPRLYFCPADRSLKRKELRGSHTQNAKSSLSSSLRWLSAECGLSFQDQHVDCSTELKGYRDWSPDDFKGAIAEAGPRPADDGDHSGHRADSDTGGRSRSARSGGGECLEFGTHWTDVRQEWSASWNEVTLRASFEIGGDADGLWDELREVELGYRPAEWVRGDRKDTLDRYYYPLLRVPYFLIDSQASSPTGGVATRGYLGEEKDKGLRRAEKCWWIYGAMQVPVDNATVPHGSRRDLLPEQEASRRLKSNGSKAEAAADRQRLTSVGRGRVGVVHVVLTLEDFTEYDIEVISYLVPLLQALGEIAGVAALLLLWGRCGSTEPPSFQVDSVGVPGAASCGFNEVSVPRATELSDRLCGVPRSGDDVRYYRLATDEPAIPGEEDRLTEEPLDEEGDGGL